MEPYQKFPKIPENYVHYPLRFYGNIMQSFPNSGAPAGPENRFPRQQNVLRGAPRNITDNDKLTNNFLNSVQQFESMKNEFRSRHLHQQANSQRQENLPNFHQNRQNYRSCLNQRLYNPLTGNFESTSSNYIPRNTNIHPNLRFRIPNPAFMSHQMQQRFNLPPCPADLIPPLLPPPVPPMLPPPLPPLPQFQGQGQKFLTNSNYRDKGRIPLLNRPIGQDNVPQMTSSFLDNDTNRQDPYSMPKQSYSKGCSDNSFMNKPSMNKNHLQEDIDSVQSGPSVQCIISVNSSSIGYSDDPNFIQSYKPYECPQRFADPRYLTDCVERSQYARMTNADVTQNSKLKTKSHEKYERQMKISILGNSMNLSGKIDKCEMLTKSQNSNLNLSDFKIEKWSFTSPMKLSVKKVPSLVSRNNISMDTGKENRPQVVLKRLCKSTVKKHSKYLLLTSPNRASTPSDVKLLNQDKRSNSESNIFAQKNKLRKFELAKLESKQLNPLWLSPILSESEQSKLKSPGNESLVESSLKISGRSRPMVKSRKCNRNLFDTIPNQRVQSSQTLDISLRRKSKLTPHQASKYYSQAKISEADLDCSRLDSSFKIQQTTNSKFGNPKMFDPCVISMATGFRNSAPSNCLGNFHDNNVIYSSKYSDFGSKACNDETMQPSSFEDFEDNIGTSDHEGASIGGESTEADANSGDGSHCSSNLSQYSTVYDDFKRIQDKAIKEAKSSKKLQKCKQISTFIPSKKKWHLRSNTYPLFSPAKRTLAEKAEFKNRARHTRRGSLPENISLAPCKIVIEDLIQMKDRLNSIQRKSQTLSDRNFKGENLNPRSNSVPIKTRTRVNPAPNRNSSTGTTCTQIDKIPRPKRFASSAASCSNVVPSARNRHSSENSTCTVSSQTFRTSKSTRSMGAYFDTATSKLVTVYHQPSKAGRTKILSQPSFLQSMQAKQKLTSHLSTKDLCPKSLNTRPRSIKSPLTDKELNLNVCEINKSSARKLRPGGLGIEWAEVQSGSPFGSVKKKVIMSGSLKEPSEARLDLKRKPASSRSLENSSGGKPDSKRTSLTDSRCTLSACRRSEEEEMTCFSQTSTEEVLPHKQQLTQVGKEARSPAVDPRFVKKPQYLDGQKPYTSTFDEQSASSRSSNILQKSSQASNAYDHFQPSDGCPIDTNVASEVDSWISGKSKRKVVDIGSEITATKNQDGGEAFQEKKQLHTKSQNQDGQDLKFFKENSQEKSCQQKISPRIKHPVIQSSKLSTNRPKSPMKTRFSNGIRTKKNFFGYRNGGESPISKRSKLSDPTLQNLASPRKRSVPVSSADPAVKNDHQPKRGRPFKSKNVVKDGAQSLGHRAQSLMNPKSFKSHTGIRERGYEEVPKKKRCAEGDIGCHVPSRSTSMGLIPDPAAKRMSNNDPLSVRNDHVRRKPQNHDPDPRSSLPCDHHQELQHNVSVKPYLKGPTCKMEPNPEARQTVTQLKRTSQVCRKSTAWRDSESSNHGVTGCTNEEQSNEPSSVVPTTYSSSDSPKAKKKRQEEGAKRRHLPGGTIVKTPTATKEPDSRHTDIQSRHVRSPKQKRNKGDEESKSITKIPGKKIDPHKSQKSNNEFKQHQKHHLANTDCQRFSGASSKNNPDQLKPKRKHRRVEKQTGTDNGNAATSQEAIQNTKHQKKRSSSKPDPVSKQRLHNKEGNQKQRSHHKDKEGATQKPSIVKKTAQITVSKDAAVQGAVQKRRKPTLVITKGKRFWCTFCYGFRGALADLKVHVAENHPYRCQTCRTVFDSGFEVETHRKSHVKKLYHCKLCQRDLRYCKGIIQRHERSTYHKQLVRVQKQILEVILNKHGSQSLDGHSTELPDLSQFADLIRFPSTVSTTENTETNSFEGQNSAITRFYFDNQEIQNLLSKVEQSLKETSTKKATEVVLPQTSSLVQDQPIKIASVQPMVPPTNSQPITIETSANQPVEYQPESCSLNFPAETLKHGRFTSQSTVAIESRAVLNPSGYQLAESNSTLAGPRYDLTQSNRPYNQNQNYSTPYPSECFDFNMKFNDFAASKNEKSSENVLTDFLTTSKKMVSSDVPDDFLEFWSSNYYQNVDYFYDNIPTFGLSSNPTPVPVSVPQIVGTTNQNHTLNLHHPMKVIAEKIVSESISIADISHSSVQIEKQMPFAEKTFPYSQNSGSISALGSCFNFTQHYQTPIMSANFRNEKTINRPSATITSADLRENSENGSYPNGELPGKVMSASQKGSQAADDKNVQFECSGKTFAYPSSSLGAHSLKDKDMSAQNCKLLQMESVPMIQSTPQLPQLPDKISAKLHSYGYPLKTVDKGSSTGESTGKSDRFEYQDGPIGCKPSKRTMESDTGSKDHLQGQKQIVDSRDLDKDFQRTEILDQLLQPLISEAWCDLRSPSKHQEAIPANSLRALMEDSVQNSAIKTQLGSPAKAATTSVQMSTPETKRTQNIQSSCAKTQDTVERLIPLTNPEKHLHNASSVQISFPETKSSQNIQSSSLKTQDTVVSVIPLTKSEERLHNPVCESKLNQANDPQVDDTCVSNSEPRSKISKNNQKETSKKFQNADDLNLVNNIASQAVEKRSEEATKTVADPAMEGLTEAEENAGEVTLAAEDIDEGLEDHNDTLINNISALDDPDFSLTSLLNAVLPEEPLSSTKLPMKSLLDISETDLKMAEAESSMDDNSSSAIAHDKVERSHNLNTDTIPATPSPVKDIETPGAKETKHITASDFIENLREESAAPVNSLDRSTPEASGIISSCHDENLDGTHENLDGTHADSGLEIAENSCCKESLNTKLIDETQDIVNKNTSVQNLSKDKNMTDGEASERQAYFASLKLCQSQDLSNNDALSTNSDTDTVSIELNDNIFDDKDDIEMYSDKTEIPNQDSNSIKASLDHSLSQSISEIFPCLASVLITPPSKKHFGTGSSDVSTQEKTPQSANRTFNSSVNASVQSIEPELLALDMLTSPCEKLRSDFHEKYRGSIENSQNTEPHKFSGKVHDSSYEENRI